MRLHVAHSIVRRYDPPAASAIQVLRVTPRNHEGQYVINWRIDVSADAKLVGHEDAFGNITHVFTADSPLEELSVTVDGEVETQDTDGLIHGAVERFPPSLFLRDTSLTRADPAIRDFAEQVRAACGGEALAGLHALLRALRDEIASGGVASEAAATAAEAFARKRGVAQDWTPCLHRCRPQPRDSCPICRGIFLRRGRRSAGARPRLGRSLRSRPWLGRFRSGERRLPDRGLCARRHRPRCARRRPRAQQALWRWRREARSRGQNESINAPPSARWGSPALPQTNN